MFKLYLVLFMFMLILIKWTYLILMYSFFISNHKLLAGYFGQLKTYYAQGYATEDKKVLCILYIICPSYIWQYLKSNFLLFELH